MCPICAEARKLDPDGFVETARLTGATPMLDGLGDGPSTVFSY